MNFSPDFLRLFTVIAVAAVILLVFIRRFFGLKRANPMAVVAAKLGLSIRNEHDYILEHNLRDFSLSGLGRVFPRLFFVLSCFKDGIRFKIFDYNGSRFSSGIPRLLFQTMGFGEIGGKNFMHFLVAPRTLYWRLNSLSSSYFFVKDGVPAEFLKKFVIVIKKGMPVPKLTGDFFAKLLELRKPYSIETRGSQFIFYKRGAVIPAKRIEKFLKELEFVGAALSMALK